jgi:outer membrane protein OmpA-like peptidoglycan-associated protein
VLAPAETAPVRPVPPPPPVPIVPGAEGIATQINGGVRISFGAGKAELNAATEAAIRSLAASVKDNPNADLNLYAFAAGVPDDPSTPRRLSLSRALAVRAVLISEGIASTRIYPRALGASPSPLGPDGPPDRVDVVLAGTPLPAAKP